MIIRNEKYNEIRNDLQSLSETLIRQCSLVEDLFLNDWKDENYERFLENEKKINTLEETMLQKISGIVIQFSPKGKDLRKIIFCHKVIIYMELIGDHLNEIVDAVKECDVKYGDYDIYRKVLLKLFGQTQKIIQEACFSFYKEDAGLAHRIIQQNYCLEVRTLKIDTCNSILSDFEMIPLEKQELINVMSLNKTFFLMEKMIDIAIDIAKSTIFALDGNLEKES